MALKLIRLSKAYERELGDMIDEWTEDQRRNHTNHSPYAIFKNDYHDFDRYLEQLERKAPSEGRVPDSVFFLLDEDRGRLLGAVNIRHYLNEALRKSGGHIGLGIRPSERRKGYATEMIRLALEECRKLGIREVLMTCDKDNEGSARSIRKNGGVLEDEFLNEDGVIEQRYWIRLPEPEKSPFTAFCGLDCETCEARIATIRDDQALREKVAAEWSAMNGVSITPDMILCEGCRIPGVKFLYCDQLCPIRKCASSKGVRTCGDCPGWETCETLGAVLQNAEDACARLRDGR